MHFVTIMVQLLSDMMNKCGHAFRLQVAKKILPRLQVHTRHLHSYLSICTATSASAQPPQHLHSHLSICTATSASAQPPQHLLVICTTTSASSPALDETMVAALGSGFSPLDQRACTASAAHVGFCLRPYRWYVARCFLN
jgi:hypothetical protein